MVASQRRTAAKKLRAVLAMENRYLVPGGEAGLNRLKELACSLGTDQS